MYYNFSFCYVLVSSPWFFLSFRAFVFVRFLLLNKDIFKKLYRFFLTTSDSNRTLHLAFAFVGRHSAASSI